MISLSEHDLMKPLLKIILLLVMAIISSAAFSLHALISCYNVWNGQPVSIIIVNYIFIAGES